MDKYFHPTLYWACDYLSMLGLTMLIKGATGVSHLQGLNKSCCQDLLFMEDINLCEFWKENFSILMRISEVCSQGPIDNRKVINE